MAKKIGKGESVFIPFRNGESIGDSQSRPRLYLSRDAFEKHFPKHYLGTEHVDLVEYAPVEHGRWKGAGMGDYRCSVCDETVSGCHFDYCPWCGAMMD